MKHSPIDDCVLRVQDREQCNALLVELFARNNFHRPGVSRKLVDGLLADGLTISELNHLMGSYGQDPLSRAIIETLGSGGLLEISAGSSPRLCVLVPRSRGFRLDRELLAESVTVSRFTFLHPHAGGAAIETCHGTASGWISTEILPLLVEAASPSGIAITELSAGEQMCISLLNATGFLIPLGSNRPSSHEEYASWEFHDLLFHTRTRLGRTEGPIGATYRFLGKQPPDPAVRAPPQGLAVIPLPAAPDLLTLAREQSLLSIMEARRSIRAHGAIPINLRELSAFLFLTCRIKGLQLTPAGDFTFRPYPNGGGSYELEVYIASGSCSGLERGLYYYDALGHNLILLSPPTSDFESLFVDAHTASGGMCYPQVLVCVASRFRRVSWKYAGMSYATQLKNAGVLLGTFYNVATALRLAGCALGLGNSERLNALTGTDFYLEGGVTEFMLGSRAWAEA
ncbi:SagB-type dehydrogenase family enzyme [Bradyrhizobium sp. LB9.1b]